MHRAEIVMTILVGVSFAVFVAPWVALNWFHIDRNDTQGLAAIVYVMGGGSHVLMPLLIGRVRKALGLENGPSLRRSYYPRSDDETEGAE